MTTVTHTSRQRSVRELESKLLKLLTVARLTRRNFLTKSPRFEIRKMLGRGANGIVCEAVDIKMMRMVALKLFPGLLDDQLARDVRNEAQTSAGLDHPYIVRVHDYDAVSLAPDLRCFYVSMELLEGTSLRHWLSRPRAPEEILQLFCRAGEGLAAAHTKGYIHRDFKPENVMVVDDVPKIVDFGLATQVVTSERTTGPEKQQPLGTLAYMAPEALRGKSGTQTDQFAFAASVWEAIYQEFPYVLQSIDPRIRGQIWPPKLQDSRPVELLHILRRALHGNPAKRFPSMGELVAALRSVLTLMRGESTDNGLESLPSISSVSPSVTQLPEQPKPRRGPYLLGGLFAGLGIVGVGAYMSGVSRDLSGLGVPLATQAAPTVPVAGLPNLASSTPPPRPCATQRKLAGIWTLRTHAQWGAKMAWNAREGDYQMELIAGEDDSCQLDLEFKKTGNDGKKYKHPLSARAHGLKLVQAPGTDGRIAVELQPRRRGASAIDFTYKYEFVFDGDQLYGAFQARDKQGQFVFGGPLRGHQGANKLGQVTFGNQPCVAQCAARCLGPHAVVQCQEACAEAPSQAVCGPPDPTVRVATPERLAQEKNCLLATKLKGEWTVTARDPKHPEQSHSYALKLATKGCTPVVVSARRMEPKPIKSYNLYQKQVQTVGSHGWRVDLRASGVSIIWEFLGHDPGFGTFQVRDAGRTLSGPLAAYPLDKGP